MSFLGKEYKFDRQESYEHFLKAVGYPDDRIQVHLDYKPTTKVIKEGDKYKSISITDERVKVTPFESGVTFEEEIDYGVKVNTTYTVDGDKIIQVLDSCIGKATFIREFRGDELKVTITTDKWDGVAYKYYKA